MSFNTVPFHGKVVRVEKNNTAMEYSKGWSIDVSLDMADSSRVGQDWKEGLPGQAGWTGSFEAYTVLGNTEQKAFFDNLVTATPGTKLTDVIFLLEGATSGFTGDLFITGMSMNPTNGDVVSATFNFQGDGALAVSAST